MKRNTKFFGNLLRSRRVLQRVISLALLVVLMMPFITPVFADGPELPSSKISIVSLYLRTQANPTLKDDQKIANTIDTYFKLRYEGQKSLKLQDFSFLTFDSPEARSWARKEQEKRGIELFVASVYKLNYVKYEYNLDYDSIEMSGDEATVKLRESHSVVFEAIAPEVSKLSGIEHVITLHKIGGRWVITNDEYQDELMQLMAYETKDELIEHVRLNRQAELLQKNAVFNGMSTKDNQPKSIESGAWHSYDRSAAKSYADYWWNKRNQDFNDYDSVGGDCTNFVSQVIYAGAPQMDNTGSYQWYNYGNWVHSPSWTAVSWLYDYLTHNTWTGPYGYDSSMCNMISGDVVQLYNGSYWAHSVVVVDSYYPYRCWNPSYIWVDAHTYDRYHYPLSYYSWATSRRYIKIGGWRD